jgi:hypothetical protein
MLQKFKITSYAFIVALLFVLPSQPVAENATSCKGWNCSIEGSVCPQVVPGASAGDFICTNSKWLKIMRGYSNLTSIAECLTQKGDSCECMNKLGRSWRH